ASWAQRHMATVAAILHGRYDPMVQAMRAEGVEPVLVEDLVRYGEDIGFARGLRVAIFDAVAGRERVIDEAQRRRIETETDPERLRAWLRALVAGQPIEP